jgi:microcystin-dependent protein
MFMDPLLVTILMFGGNFAPRGWAFCNGQILSIAQNTAVFSLLGTTYGGNGVTTFALPNMQGRMPMHWGTGPGLTPRSLGEQGGTESQTLNVNQMPVHNHLMRVSTRVADSVDPTNRYLAEADGQGQDVVKVYTPDTPNASLNPAAITTTGGSQPFPTLSPFLCVSFIIALEGIFPSRN